MRLTFILVLILLLVKLSAQKIDTLYVNYITHAPFAYKEGNEMKGIEIELILEYAAWLNSKKNMTVELKYSGFNDYKALYEETRVRSKKSFGLAAAIIKQDNSDVDFSLPYIKNVAFCITNGSAPDIKIKTEDEVVKVFGSMTALTIQNTLLYKHMEEFKKLYIPDLKLKFFESQIKILDEISRNVLTFAYVDGITFWRYLKDHPSKSLKMQRVMSQNKEEIGFILPKGCPHNPLFKEFFNAYRKTSAYRSLLEKYLGTYMTHNLALN